MIELSNIDTIRWNILLGKHQKGESLHASNRNFQTKDIFRVSVIERIRSDCFLNNGYFRSALLQNHQELIGRWPYQPQKQSSIIITILWIVFFLQAIPQIRNLFDKVQRDWKLVMNDEEKRVLQYHSEIGRLLTAGYTVKNYSKISLR
ncbi:Protein of unknown function [Cotesia congregata]|uniref:Uncharacterized protein n=1 Tax=Cotesia congregata TaxID=51543 RepID=A0A8J2HQB2_COTCN|nr:Protein of unknown function [Cotesia congregata]